MCAETRGEQVNLNRNPTAVITRPRQRSTAVGGRAFNTDGEEAGDAAYDSRCLRGSRAGARRHGFRALLLAALPCIGLAQDDDLPGRVGRVAEFAGQLLLSQQDRPDEWEPVGINYPITSGVNLWVSSDGRAGNRLRRRSVPARGRYQRARGTARRSRARALRRAGTRDRPRARAGPGRGNAHRHAEHASHADACGTLSRRCRAGSARRHRSSCARAKPNVALADRRRGRCSRARRLGVAGADPAIADVRYAQGADGFDTWSANRDRRYEGLRSSAYVSRQMVGAADLDRLRSVADDAGLRCRLVSVRRGAGLGAAIATATGPTSADGARRGSTARHGATRHSITAAGRSSAAAGAGARAATWRVRSGRRRSSPGTVAQGWGRRHDQRQAALRLGAARLARAVLPRLAPMLVQLLGALQPPVRSRCERSARARRRRAAPTSRCRARCRRVPATSRRRHTPVRSNLGECSGATRIVGAAHEDDSLGWLRPTAGPRSDAGDVHSSACGVHLCDGAEAGCRITGNLAPASRSRKSERIRPRCEQRSTGRDNRSARAGARDFRRLRNGRPMSPRWHTHRAGLRRRRSRRSSGNRRA